MFYFQLSLAQVSDDFADGDFSNDPAWAGDDTDFDASGFELQLDAATAGESYLSTSQTKLGETTWEFLTHFDFNPSSTSLAKVYLVSDQENLTGSLNGYFVMIGDSDDEISLYKQNGTTEEYVIDGTDDVINASSVNVRVKVIRDATGNWELFHDTSGGSDYTQEGTSTLDNEFTNTSYFGIFCEYIDSRKSAIYFDDIYVVGFTVASIALEDSNSIRITFNQNVDEISGETLSNYSINYGYGSPISAERDITNLDEVVLIFSEDFVNNSYTLNIDQVENDADDDIISNLNQTLSVEKQTPFRDIVINEIFADVSPQIGLPSAEYLELYNSSSQAINIGGFTIDSKTLDDFVLESQDYLILTSTSNVGEFSGNIMGLSSFSLTDGGEALTLLDNLGNTVDSVSYNPSWYKDSEKDDGGYSLEQINPELTCSYENNWTASNDADGGTPGTQNSVYDNTADTDGPNLVGFTSTDANTLLLTFDEPMDETSLNGASYTFDNGISENGITPISPGFFSTWVDVTPDLTSGTTYVITVTGATDCEGNAAETNSLSFSHDTNPPELERVIVMSTNQIDILFNENLNQAVAETESNYTSNHSGGNPSSAELSETDFSLVSLIFEDDFSLEVEHTLTVENLEDTQGNALVSALSPTFTYAQDVDSVYVIGINLLDIYFSEDLEESSAIDPDNYEVNDDVGNPSSAFFDGSNDRLIHLAFANNFDDNKELTLNISDIQNDDGGYLTTPEINFVYDTSPPKIDTIYVTSSTTLDVIFAEKVGSQSAQSKENYEYDEIFPVEAILEEDQQTVLLTFDQDFEREVVFELYIDEIKDLYGNEIKTRIKQELVYDVFEPQLDSIRVRSANEIVLWFNENIDQSTAENVTNYSVGGEQPLSATLNLEYQDQVYLELNNDLPEEAEIVLEVSDMEDQRKNSITSVISTTFDYDVFYIGRIQPMDQTSLQLEFNKIPDSNTKSALSNYMLNGEEAVSIDFLEDRVATVTFPTQVEDDTDNALNVESLTDQNSNPLSINTYSFHFDSRISNSSLVGDRTIVLEFEVGLDEDQVLSTADFSASPTLGNCLAAVIDSENSEILRLTFEHALTADISYQISWQSLINEFGNALPNYSITAIKDLTPASLVDHQVLDENSVWLRYSELLNETSAEFLFNYHVAPDIAYPISAKYDEADSSVLLDFSSSFLEGTNYTLTLDHIEDLADNVLLDYSIDFTFEAAATPGFGDLIITEIMADPTPEVGLSDKEYLEIYNTTEETISLAGISIVDEGGVATIVSGEIESGAHLVLTSNSGVSDFSYVSVIGVTSFPSLNNTGETISLYTNDQLIFSTSYSTDWYKDSDKEEGGWSLEMIDTSNPCGEYSNWTASAHALGGTPGLPNSVLASNPDHFGPQLISAIATTENSIELTINEKLHPDSFANAQILLSPSKAFSNSTLVEPENIQIEITLAEELESGQSYEIELSNLSDCLSNGIDAEQNSAAFRLPESADPKDIVINEVLFNPRVGGVDFVEIYNNSEKAINLKDWMLGDKLNDQKVITHENLVLNPFEYLALSPDPAILITEYPKGDNSRMATMNSFPSLADNEDSVLLISSEGLLIDEMKYEDDYHFNLLDDDNGVSLERVSFEAESTNPDSWRSAASTVGFATPGVTNSQIMSANQSSATVSIDPRVFIPDSTGFNDYTTINYQLAQSGNFANVHVYSVNGVLIKTLAEGELLSTTGFFTWDGTTNQGNLASVGYYVVIFETFDGQGNKSIEKETVVLGTRF